MAEGALLKYDEACQAVSALRTFEEAKEFADKAEAIRVYARRAKNRDLELDAAEIRIRSERRLGEILRDYKERGQLRKGGRPSKAVGPITLPPTLTECGIDRKLSMRSQRLARVPCDHFERQLASLRSRAANSCRSAHAPEAFSVRGSAGDVFELRICGRRLGGLRLGELRSISRELRAQLQLLELVQGRASVDSTSTIQQIVSAAVLESLFQSSGVQR